MTGAGGSIGAFRRRGEEEPRGGPAGVVAVADERGAELAADLRDAGAEVRLVVAPDGPPAAAGARMSGVGGAVGTRAPATEAQTATRGGPAVASDLEQLIAAERELLDGAVAVVRATRNHPELRSGSSVRGSIDLLIVAGGLAKLRGPPITSADITLDATLSALSGRIRLVEGAGRSAEELLEELWATHLAHLSPEDREIASGDSADGSPGEPDEGHGGGAPKRPAPEGAAARA